ncbi:MAG: HAD-IA family hydrolase [Actinobacteria bacterium]|nr:HAD-IA family hydrolase [Actinomycetota bacterium]
MDEALAAGMRIAVASTSAEESVRGVVRRVLGDRPVLVFAGDVVPAKKPDPAIYLLALRELGVDAAEAVAIEDTRNGVLAAAGAGIACVAAPSSFTHGDDFSEAALVVADLRDVTLADLEGLRT